MTVIVVCYRRYPEFYTLERKLVEFHGKIYVYIKHAFVSFLCSLLSN